MSPSFDPKELKNSKRIFKSATPKYTIDWYIKWFSSIILLFAMSFRGSPDLKEYDLILSFMGCMGWLCVGVIWKDRALIILNTAAVMILGNGIVQYFFGG